LKNTSVNFACGTYCKGYAYNLGAVELPYTSIFVATGSFNVFQCFSMFERDSTDTSAEKCPLVLMGGRAEGLARADPEARTPIGASGIWLVNTPLVHQYQAPELKQELFSTSSSSQNEHCRRNIFDL
jgi:hypothetical protein